MGLRRTGFAEDSAFAYGVLGSAVPLSKNMLASCPSSLQLRPHHPHRHREKFIDWSTAVSRLKSFSSSEKKNDPGLETLMLTVPINLYLHL